MKTKALLSSIALASLISSTAFGNGASSARTLAQKARNMSNRIGQMLRSAENNRLEDDQKARTGLLQAQERLDDAADRALEAEDYFNSGFFNEGMNQFVFACTKSAGAKSRIATAMLWANRPPFGSLSSFTPELQDMKGDIEDFRTDPVINCP